MAYASAEGGGGYGVDASIIHFDPAHADHIRVPDAELLFRGEYQRLGPDLVVTGPDGRHHIIPGYFSSEKHPALVAPNGASLTPDVVDLLAGSPTPGQYAQAQPTTPPDAIGKVEKVIGSVTVVRNGVAVALHVGDAVYKSDVVQTGANSSVGIGFPDGTALNLVANTRMALNDYSFDASGTSNSALFTLVEGTFAFVAGKVAHDGNMKVATPVATMGIRGTTVYFAMVTSSLGEVQYLAQLFADYQTGHVGAVEWFDNNPASPTYGQLIDTITDTGYAHYFTPRLGQSPLVNVQPATNFPERRHQRSLPLDRPYHQRSIDDAQLRQSDIAGHRCSAPDPAERRQQQRSVHFQFLDPGSHCYHHHHGALHRDPPS